MESSHVLNSVLHVALYKTFFLDFWFVAMATKFGIFLQKIQYVSFLFLDGIEPFWAVISSWPPLQNVVLTIWFKPPNAQNLLPQMCIKSPISRLPWQIERRRLGIPGGFRGWPIQWNHAKCCGADPCCHGNEICARRGDQVAYQLVLLILQAGAMQTLLYMEPAYTGWPKKIGTIFLYTLTLPNINRFSKLFHCQNQEKICNNTLAKDPTTPQVCRYTTL